MLELLNLRVAHAAQHINYVSLPEGEPHPASGTHSFQHSSRYFAAVYDIGRVLAQIAVAARLRLFAEIAQQHLPAAFGRLAVADESV